MLTPELQAQRENRGLLVQALGVTLKGNNCRCPYHDDAHPSASVFHADDRAWKFHCHVCNFTGDVFDVRARGGGVTLSETLKTESLDYCKPEKIYPSVESIEKSLSNHEATYRYTNPETGEIDLLVFRWRRDGETKKSFLQGRQVENGFVLSAPKGKLPLYNRKRVAQAEEVILVEGEKCVHALHEIGMVATTTPGGAGKSHNCDLTPLAGKVVYLWADNDEKGTGEAHMREVASRLETLGAQARWVDYKSLNLPPKGDVVEYLERNGGSAEDKRIAVQLVLEEAEGLGASRELESRLNDMMEGRWFSIEWPWPLLSRLSQSLLPGTITVLPGEAGGSKSFMLLEAMWYWHVGGIKTAIYELEEDRTYHLIRALAQLEENSNLTDPNWIFEHPEDVKAAFARNRDLVDSFGRTIYDAPDKLVPLDKLTEWVEEQCARGCQIVAIDPITAAQGGKEPWLDDQRFILTAKAIVRRYNARLILVTHPKKSRGRGAASNLNDMAGGAAYERFSQSVLWLERHDKPQSIRVMRDGLVREVTSDRSIQIRKARNGRGTGAQLSYCFDFRSLRFAEQGIVLPETENAVAEKRIRQQEG
jgi:hypothetical protein